MAAAYICDGCARPVDNPAKVGRALRRDYCTECEPKAQAFVDAEEALRKRLTEQFHDDRAMLIATASADGFRLPDVPHAS